MEKIVFLFKHKSVQIAIAGIVISILGFYFAAGYLERLKDNKAEAAKLESLVKKESVYLDESQLIDSVLGDKVYSVFKTDEGDFALIQVVNAKIKEGKFVGNITVRFPNGDLYSGSAGTFIPEIILRDGSKLPAQVVENALTSLKLSDGRSISVELNDAEIIDGAIIELFAARGINTGYSMAGRILNGKVIDGYIVTNPTYVPAKSRVFGYLLMIEDRKVTQASVLSAEDGAEIETSGIEGKGVLSQHLGGVTSIYEYQGSIITPNYDKGTYKIAGLEEGTDVTVGLIQDIVTDSLANLDITNLASAPAEGPVPAAGFKLADDSVLSRHIKDGEVRSADILDGTITGADIANDTIKNEDIADSAINSAKIEDGTVTSTDINDNTINTSDLAAALTFSDGDFLDLSAIIHDDSTPQGLRLPNVTGSNPVSPSSGEGYLAYDISGDQVIYYNGSSWAPVGSGDVTGVAAGNGLTGGGTSGDVSLALSLTTSGGAGSTSSNSGLEVGSAGLTLLKGCADGEILKWNDSSALWECAVDGGGGGGAAAIQEGDTTVTASATVIDFLAADFIVTDSPAGEANIAIDYTNSFITRSNQTESISGAWTLQNLTVSDTNIAFSGGSTTFDFAAAATRTLTLTNSNVSNVLNLSVEGDVQGTSFTVGGDTIDEFVGTGLQLSSGDLQTTLGTSISNTEIDADTIDWDRIANSMTLDEATDITAASSLNLTIGNNVNLVASGTGTIVATDLTCTNCIGPTEISDITLGTDTSGDFVATITAGDGLASTGATSGEAVAHSLSVNVGNGIQLATDAVALGALTANWDQTGAFDIVLNNSGSELIILDSDGTHSATFDVGNLTADATYTFLGASGNVLTSVNASSQLSSWDQDSSDDLTTSNYAATLDSVYVNAGESPTAGDISGSFTAGLTIGADSVALGTDTTGNYVAGATANQGLNLTGSEGGTLGITLQASKGLEVDANGLSLIDCGNNEVLKYSTGTNSWTCQADDTGTDNDTNYWAKALGVLSPNGTDGEVIAATSGAQTVATFTSLGSVDALRAGSSSNYITVDSNGNLNIRSSQDLRLYDSDNTNYSGFQANATTTQNSVYTLPAAFPGSSGFLKSDTSGNLSFDTSTYDNYASWTFAVDSVNQDQITSGDILDFSAGSGISITAATEDQIVISAADTSATNELQNLWATFNADGATTTTADSQTDTLTISGSGIVSTSITGDVLTITGTEADTLDSVAGRGATTTTALSLNGGLSVDSGFVVADGGSVSTLTISDTNIPLTGAGLTFDFNNATDRTFTITNSDGTGLAHLTVEGNISAANFSGSSSGTNTGDQNLWATFNAPNGTDPVANSVTDTLNFLDGTGITITGDSGADSITIAATLGTAIDTSEITDGTITGDDIASSFAGAGLVLTTGSPDVLNIGAGDGITVNADSVALASSTAGEGLGFASGVLSVNTTGGVTTSTDNVTLLLAAGSGLSQASGLTIRTDCGTNQVVAWDGDSWECADKTTDTDTNFWALTNGVLSPDPTESAYVLAATSAATTVATFTTTGAADSLAFKAGGTSTFVTIDKEGDLVASGNISGNNLSGTNTGDVTLAGTPDYITISGQIITRNKLDPADDLNTFASSVLSGLLTDETGSGAAVFGTSPELTTSLTTGSASFDLLNTTATTINFAGAASTLNIGPGSTTAASVNLAGGSGATGCTVDGATGNFTCSGNITATGTIGGSNFSGTSSGTNTGDQNLWATFNAPNGTDPVANSVTDTLNFLDGTGITITGDSGADSITIAASLGTAIDTSEITDGTITGDDLNANLAGAGLVLTAGSPDTLDIGAGNGITVASDSITLDLGNSGSVATGLQVDANGLSLITTCGEGQLLEYTSGSGWACADDDTGGAGVFSANGNILHPTSTDDQLVIGGNNTTSHFFEVNGAQIGKALVSLVETGDQNILTASASATTVFNLTRTGELQAADLTLGLNDTTATISTQDTNEDLTLDPNGTGDIYFHGSTYQISDSGDLTIGGRATFENAEYISNETNGSVIFSGSGGSNDTDLIIDLDDAAGPILSSATDTAIQFAENLLFVGSQTIDTTTGNIVLGAAGSGTSANVYIGGSAASTTPDLLVVGQKSDAGAPTGAEGAIYYNASVDKFYIYEGGGSPAWKEICNKTDAACGAGSGSAWSALSAPSGPLTLDHGENVTSFTWNTADTAGAFDAFTLALTNDASTDANTQRVLVLQNNSTATTNTTERLLVLNNADTDGAVTTALEILSGGGAITTALDVSDSEIGTAIALGSNDITTTSTTIAATELDLLDGHDAALVDTNDTVSTAIIGTGALNSGSITNGFGSIDTGNDAITTTGTVTAGTLSINSESFTDLTGNGLTNSTNVLTLNLGNAAAVSTGLTVDGNGLSLITTCDENYILKWTDVGGWACQPDDTGTDNDTTYWALNDGVLSPDAVNDNAYVVAATSAATTVGTFTTTGDANALAFKAGGTSTFVTIDKEGDLVASGNISATGTIGGSNFSGSSSGTNTGDQTITLEGDVTGTGTGTFTTSIAANTIDDSELVNTLSYTGALTLSQALAANGGITFDAATDTVGAHTLAGTIDAATNVITNIGNAGTDFTGTGGLNLAENLDLEGTITAGSGGVVLTNSTGNILHDSLVACGDGQYLRYIDGTDKWECSTITDNDTTYWALTNGVLSPDAVNDNAYVVAATSAATTVGTFTTTGDANALAFKAGGTSTFVTIDKEGDLVAAGDVQVNGGNITSTGALDIASGGSSALSLDSASGTVTINASDALGNGTWNLTSAGVLSGLTGITSSGTITFSGLTPDRLVTTTTGGELTTTISSANLAESVTGETGSGALVFGTSPTLSGPTITGSPTASGATWTDLGSVTTADINGGSIDGTTIGAVSPSTGVFTDLSSTGTTVIGDAATDTLTINSEILGASPLTFEGATNDNIYTIFAITDPTTSSKTITFKDETGTVAFLTDIPTSDNYDYWTLSDGSNTTNISSTNTAAFTGGTGITTTNTTGTIDIDFDSTEIETTTWGAATTASEPFTWTFDVTSTGTDPTIAFGDNTQTLTAATITLAGNVDATNGLDITGNSLTVGGNATITTAGAATFASTLTANGNTVLGDAATDQLTVNSEILGTTPLKFEGTTNDNIYTQFTFTDPTTSTKTITFPDLSGTVILSGHSLTGDVTGTLGTGGTTALTVASGAVADDELADSLSYTGNLTLSNALNANGGITTSTTDTTLVISANGAGIVDVQDSLTANTLTVDAGDIIVSSTGGDIQILDSDGTHYGTLDVGNLAGAATYTFSGTSGTVLTDANYSGTLDSVYVNVAESPAVGDITGSFSGGLNIGSNVIDFDNIATSLTLDASTDITAASALNFTFGTNVTLVAGTVDINGGNIDGTTIGGAVAAAGTFTTLNATGNFDTDGTITAGSGGVVLTNSTGNILHDALVACSDGQYLRYIDVTDKWECSTITDNDTTYWALTNGVLSPDAVNDNAYVIAATSAATTVGTFTTTGDANALAFRAGGESTYVTIDKEGDLVVAGNIDINGTGTHDIAGTLNLSGAGGLTFGTTGPITLAGGVISDVTDEVDINDSVAIANALQVGGTSAVAFSRFGTGTAGHVAAGEIEDTSDVFISDDLEVDGTVWGDGGFVGNLTGDVTGNVSGTAGSVSFANVTGGTNANTLVIGTGGSLSATGTGTITATDLTCTNCLNEDEIADIFVLNTGDVVTLGAAAQLQIDGSSTTNTGTTGILDVNLSTNASQSGIDISATSVADTAADTISGLKVTGTVSTDADNIYAIQLADLSGTPTAGNEYAIYQAGTNWDYGLYIEDAAHFNTTSAFVGNADFRGDIADSTGNLTLNDAVDISGITTLTLNLNANGGLDVDDALVVADGGELTTSQLATFNGTLDANGIVTLGDGGDAITIDSNALTLQTTGAGSDITINAVDQIILSDFITDANAVLYTTTAGALTRVAETETGSLCLLSGAGASGVPTWGSCPGGSGSLDDAYNNGQTITVDAADVLLNLSDASADYKFTIDNATTGDIATAFAITSTGVGGTTQTAIDLTDADIVNALAIGANNITTAATTIASTELDLLDGHDAALVDINDAVATAITGTGALNSGSITSGFGTIDTGADAISTTGLITSGALTATGDVTMNDAGADNILIGAAADTVTLTSNTLSLTDDNWSVSAAGAAAFASVSEGGTALSAKYAPIGADFITVTANGTLTGETGIDNLTTAISTTNTLNVDSTSTLNTVTLDANANLTTTAGTGSLILNSTVTSAGDKVVEIVPSYTGEATDALTYSIIDIAAFSANNAAGTDTVKGLSVGNLTETGGISSTAIQVGTGWDTILGGTTAGTSIFDFTNFDVTSAGAVTAVSLDLGEGTVDNLAGNAGLAISTGDLIIDVATTSTTATTSSNSGLEIGTDGLRLIGGCTSGTTDILKWNGTTWACAADDTGSATAWSAISAPTGDLALTFDDGETTSFSATTTANESFFSMALDNDGGTAGNDYLLSLSNTVSTQTTGDLNTEALILLDQADTTAAGTTALDNAILITNSGGSTLTDAIQIGTGTQAITNGINFGSTGITDAIVGTTVSGNIINFTNFDVTSAGALTAVGVDSGSGLIQGSGGLSITAGDISLTDDSGTTWSITNAGVANFGASVTIAGSGDGTDALTLTAGDILVSDGDFDLSGGDFNVTLDAADAASVTKSTNTTGGDVLSLSATSTADAAADTYNGLTFAWTESTDADTFNAINLGSVTSTNSNTVGITAGTGWDTILGGTTAGTSIFDFTNFDVTSAGAVTAVSLDLGEGAVDNLAGNAGLAISTGDLIIDVATTSTTATTSSNSGLEIGTDGLRLIGGCTSGTTDILKWNGSAWACAADDDSGGTIGGSTGSTDNALLRADGTGGSTLQSSTATLSDTGDLTLYDATNDGNPVFAFGAAAAERLTIVPTYDTGAQTLDYVLFQTDAASATADKGEMRFSPDGTLVATIDDGGIELADAKAYFIDTSEVLNETTLGSSVVNSSLTSVGTLTSLQVDNINIDANTISSTSGAINITPIAGSAIVLDGTINVDGGVVTGATSITTDTLIANTLLDVNEDIDIDFDATDEELDLLATLTNTTGSDYDLTNITKTAVVTDASTDTYAGSVFHASLVNTETSGTITDTTNLIELTATTNDGWTGYYILAENASGTDRFTVDSAGNVIASGTIAGSNLSGTNTGDQSLFSTFAVSGQSDVVADAASDTLTLIAGTNVTITTNATNDEITINSSGAGATAWDDIADPDLSSTIAHTNFGTDFTWDVTGNDEWFSLSLDNNGGTAGNDYVAVIRNAVSDQTTGDLNTEALLWLDQADTTTSGNTAVDNALLITNSGGSTLTDAIDVSGSNITNALNVGANQITGTDWTIINTTDIAEGLTFTLAGGVGFDITGEAGQDFRVTNTGGSILLNASEAAADAIVLNASNAAGGIDINAGTGDIDIDLTGAGADFLVNTSDGAITLTAAGAANGDITLAATDDIDINGTAGSLVNIGTSSVTQTITLGNATNTDLVLNDAHWSVTGAGAAAFASVSEGGTALSAKYAPIGADFITVTANGTLTGETGIDNLTTAISTTNTLNVDSTSTLNNVTLDANANLTTTAGTGSLILNSTVTSAGDKVVEIVPSYTGEATDALTYSIFDIAAFTATNAVGTDTVKGLSVGNLTESGGITSTALSVGTGWDTILGGTTAGTSIFDFTNFDVTSAGAVTAVSLNLGEGAVDNLAGNAGLAISTGALIIDVATTSTTATTSSNSGLEIGTDGLRLIGGCTSGTTDILKWNGTTWACAADNGTSYTFSDGVSESGGVVKLGGADIDEARTLTVATGGTLNIDLTSVTGGQDFIIKDAGTAFATFANTGAISFAPTSGQNLSITTADAGVIDLTSGATTGNAASLTANSLTTGTGLLVSSTGTIVSGGELMQLTANSLTTGRLLDISATGLTTGRGVSLTGSSASPGQTGPLLYLTGNLGNSASTGLITSEATINTTSAFDTGINTKLLTTVSNSTNINTSWGLLSNVNDATNLGNFLYAVDGEITISGNAAKTAYGVTGNVSSSSTVGDTLYSGYFATSESGAVTSGTQNAHGIYALATSSNVNGGTANIYGVKTFASGTVTSGIINAYGLYVENGSMNTTGTSSQYGLYLESISGADTNYAIYSAGGQSYLAGNLGIGDSDPSGTRLDIGANTTTLSSLRLNASSAVDVSSPAIGDLWFNGTNLNFRKDGSTTVDLLAGGAVTLQQAYDAGTPTITTDASGDIIFQTIAGTTDTQFKVEAITAGPEKDMVFFTNTGQGTTTTGVDVLQIDLVTAAVAGSVDNAGLRVNVTATGATEAGDTYKGISIESITNQTGLGTALNIGTGWDRGLTIASAESGGTAAYFSNTATDATGGIQFGSSDPVYVFRTGTGELTISDTTTAVLGTDDYFQFDTQNGPVYSGGARPTRKVTLAPEYAGATLSGTGTGTMTSDFCSNTVGGVPDTNTGVCNTSGDIHNYYSWAGQTTSQQTYNIYIRWRVPDNFASFADVTDPIKVYAKAPTVANTFVKAYVYDTAGALENTGGTEVDGTTWTQTSVEATFAGTYTAGSYMTIRLELSEAGSDTIQVGEISVDYKSNN